MSDFETIYNGHVAIVTFKSSIGTAEFATKSGENVDITFIGKKKEVEAGSIPSNPQVTLTNVLAKASGIVLLLDTPEDMQYIRDLQQTSEWYTITINHSNGCVYSAKCVISGDLPVGLNMFELPIEVSVKGGWDIQC